MTNKLNDWVKYVSMVYISVNEIEKSLNKYLLSINMLYENFSAKSHFTFYYICKRTWIDKQWLLPVIG